MNIIIHANIETWNSLVTEPMPWVWISWAWSTIAWLISKLLSLKVSFKSLYLYFYHQSSTFSTINTIKNCLANLLWQYYSLEVQSRIYINLLPSMHPTFLSSPGLHWDIHSEEEKKRKTELCHKNLTLRELVHKCRLCGNTSFELQA